MVVGIRQTRRDDHRTAHRPGPPGVGRERLQRDHGEQEHDRQPGQQDVQRDFVRRLLPLGAFDQRDHAVEKGRALRRGDADPDPVGQHLGAAGHGRAVAAGFADDRRGLAGDRRLVDRGDALDDLAVAGNELPVLTTKISPLRRLGRNSPLVEPTSRRGSRRFRSALRRLSAWALPRPSAIASAKFAKRTVNQSQSEICNSSRTLVDPRRWGQIGRTRSARCRLRRQTSPGSAPWCGMSFPDGIPHRRFTIVGSHRTMSSLGPRASEHLSLKPSSGSVRRIGPSAERRARTSALPPSAGSQTPGVR